MTHRIERTMVGTIPGTFREEPMSTNQKVRDVSNTCQHVPRSPEPPPGLPVLVRSAGFGKDPPTPVEGSLVMRLHRMYYPLFYTLFFPYSHGG